MAVCKNRGGAIWRKSEQNIPCLSEFHLYCIPSRNKHTKQYMKADNSGHLCTLSKAVGGNLMLVTHNEP